MQTLLLDNFINRFEKLLYIMVNQMNIMKNFKNFNSITIEQKMVISALKKRTQNIFEYFFIKSICIEWETTQMNHLELTT